MPTPQRPFEEHLLEQLRSALSGLPDAEVRPSESAFSRRDKGLDAEVSLIVSGHPIRLLIECKSTAFPRDIRQALWQLKESQLRWKADYPSEVIVPLIAAESISAGARELLRKEGVGYFDTGGSLFLPARGAYAFIDKPVPRALARSIRSLFTGRRSQVLHAMLRTPREWFGVKELAKNASVSPATVSETLSELEKHEWITSRGSGPAKERSLIAPAALLDAWARHVENTRPHAIRRYFVPSIQPHSLARHFAVVCEANDAWYALTHEVAAQHYAPFLTHVSQVRCRLLRSSAAEGVIHDLGARVVHEGANLAIIEAKSPGELLFRQRVDDIWFADPIQVYLDLLLSEGRGKEAAEHLRHEKIGF